MAATGLQQGINKSSAVKTILLAGLIAGTLDMSAALLVYCAIMKVVTPVQLLNGIASGVFDKTTIGSEMVMVLIGLVFHYFIAYCFATAYFLVYPHIKLLHRNAIVSGLLYGIFVWIIMNRIVVPLSNAYHSPFKWSSAIRGAAILMICIGLPISLITAKYYNTKVNS